MSNETTPEAIRLAEWIEEDMTCQGDAEIAAELRRMHAEIAVLKADAERYRWLKARPEVVPTEGPDLALWSDCCGDALRGDEADKAIDAAMKKGA
jgi:hypothetical protein